MNRVCENCHVVLGEGVLICPNCGTVSHEQNEVIYNQNNQTGNSNIDPSYQSGGIGSNSDFNVPPPNISGVSKDFSQKASTKGENVPTFPQFPSNEKNVNGIDGYSPSTGNDNFSSVDFAPSNRERSNSLPSSKVTDDFDEIKIQSEEVRKKNPEKKGDDDDDVSVKEKFKQIKNTKDFFKFLIWYAKKFGFHFPRFPILGWVVWLVCIVLYLANCAGAIYLWIQFVFLRYFNGEAFPFFSVGQHARGVIAIGQFAEGVFCIGQLSFCAVSIGQLNITLIGLGQVGVGVLFGIFQACLSLGISGGQIVGGFYVLFSMGSVGCFHWATLFGGNIIQPFLNSPWWKHQKFGEKEKEFPIKSCLTGCSSSSSSSSSSLSNF